MLGKRLGVDNRAKDDKDEGREKESANDDGAFCDATVQGPSQGQDGKVQGFDSCLFLSMSCSFHVLSVSADLQTKEERTRDLQLGGNTTGPWLLASLGRNAMARGLGGAGTTQALCCQGFRAAASYAAARAKEGNSICSLSLLSGQAR